MKRKTARVFIFTQVIAKKYFGDSKFIASSGKYQLNNKRSMYYISFRREYRVISLKKESEIIISVKRFSFTRVN